MLLRNLVKWIACALVAILGFALLRWGPGTVPVAQHAGYSARGGAHDETAARPDKQALGSPVLVTPAEGRAQP